MEGKSKTGLPRVRASSSLPRSWQGFRFFTGEEGHIGGTALLPGVLAPPQPGDEARSPTAQPRELPSLPTRAYRVSPCPRCPSYSQLPELPANGPTHPRALCVGGWGPQAEDRSPRAPCEWKPGPTCAGGDAKGHGPGQHQTLPSRLQGSADAQGQGPRHRGSAGATFSEWRTKVACPARASLQAALGPEPWLASASVPWPPTPVWAFDPPSPSRPDLCWVEAAGRSLCPRRGSSRPREWTAGSLFTQTPHFPWSPGLGMSSLPLQLGRHTLPGTSPVPPSPPCFSPRPSSFS